MKKILIYAMEGKKMCFLHALMNAKQLKGGGHDVKIVIEGQACTLIGELEKDENKLYLSLKEDGTTQVFASPVQGLRGLRYEQSFRHPSRRYEWTCRNTVCRRRLRGHRFLTVAICHPLCQKA